MKPAALRQLSFLEARGLSLEPEELQNLLKFAIAQLQQSLYPPEPRADLPRAEAETLARGGLELGAQTLGSESALARTTARYAALLETSLTTARAAQLLGVDASRIRQRLSEGSLYGIRTPKGWRLPAFQFLEEDVLPGVGEILPRLASHLHPVAIHNFFTLPSVDLYAEEIGRSLSPREWLQAGYPPERVSTLASRLE